MASTIADILTAFRSGTLSAEDAARELIPLLQTSGRLNIELSPDVQPLLEALSRLAGAGVARSAQPLHWESKHWQRLNHVADDFWSILRERRLDRDPHCLRYTFTVQSAAAASALENWIMDQSDHQVSLALPTSYEEAAGQVTGVTPARVLTKADLANWVSWLQAIPPVPDAALTDLGIAPPPPEAD